MGKIGETHTDSHSVFQGRAVVAVAVWRSALVSWHIESLVAEIGDGRWAVQFFRAKQGERQNGENFCAQGKMINFKHGNRKCNVQINVHYWKTVVTHVQTGSSNDSQLGYLQMVSSIKQFHNK